MVDVWADIQCSLGTMQIEAQAVTFTKGPPPADPTLPGPPQTWEPTPYVPVINPGFSYENVTTPPKQGGGGGNPVPI